GGCGCVPAGSAQRMPGGWAWVLWADVVARQPVLPEERPRPLGESRPVTRLVTGRCRSACPAFQLLAVGDAVAALRLLDPAEPHEARDRLVHPLAGRA